jgi:hypothetical protein
MHTFEFISGLEQITKQLKIRELLELIQPWVDSNIGNQNIAAEQKDLFTNLLLDSKAAYHELKRNSAEKSMLSELGIDQFYEPARLRAMMTALNSVGQTQQIITNPGLWQQFFTFWELLRSLIRLENATVRLLGKEKLQDLDPSRAFVELDLIEYASGEGFSPQRLQTLVGALRELHSLVSQILGSGSDQLVFRYFDSGSDLRIVAECAKTIAETINMLFSQTWEKLVFWRYESFDKKIGATATGLSLLETIQRSVENQTITQEDGENLKIRVLKELEKLTGIGVTPPLTDDRTITQRQLLTAVRDTKLLGDGTTTEVLTDSDGSQP